GVGLDYLAVSQGNVSGDGGAAANFFNSAQLEGGWYLNDDVFVVFIVSRGNDTSGSTQGDSQLTNFFRGVRVEFALTDEWFVEGFVEDRFLRGATGIGLASPLDGEKVVGVLTFWDWGYGARNRED